MEEKLSKAVTIGKRTRMEIKFSTLDLGRVRYIKNGQQGEITYMYGR